MAVQTSRGSSHSEQAQIRRTQESEPAHSSLEIGRELHSDGTLASIAITHAPHGGSSQIRCTEADRILDASRARMADSFCWERILCCAWPSDRNPFE